MEDLPLGRFAALMPEFVVKDLPLGKTLMMMNKLSGLVTALCVDKHSKTFNMWKYSYEVSELK